MQARTMRKSLITRMKENTIKAALAAALGALCAYGVQLLVPVLVLVVVMLLDYATGMTKAWNAGELSSRVGLRGILKKVGYLVIVTVAAVVDWLLRYGADTLGWDWPVEFLFASIVIIWLVINELLSILENVSAIGAPVPGFLQALLKKLKVHTEDTAEENLPGEENMTANVLIIQAQFFWRDSILININTCSRVYHVASIRFCIPAF